MAQIISDKVDLKSTTITNENKNTKHQKTYVLYNTADINFKL